MTAAEVTGRPFETLPFRIFVAVADAAESVGAAEAEAFFRLLRAGDWARCPALARSLETAAKRYPDHWRRYLAGELRRAVPSVMDAVVSASGALSPKDAEALEADLLHVARVLRKAAKRPPPPEPADPARPFAALEAALRDAATLTANDEGPASAPDRTAGPDLRPSWPSVLEARTPPWDSVRTRLRCAAIVPDTPDVRTFRFTSDAERLFSYKPGQFLTLELEIDGKRVRRSYTIASSPARPYTVEISVKRVPGGVVSNRLHDNFSVGDVVQAVVANGRFNRWDIPAERALFLSAGIGITPLMSMARWDFDLGIERDTVFFHCARAPSHIVFRKELELLDRPGFRVLVTCSRPGDEAWEGLRGRLDGAMIERAVPDFRERTVLMCGPEPWMRAMREFFLGAGVAAERLHQESFGPRGSARSVPLKREASAAGAGARVVFSRSGVEVACDADETILEAAERAGIEIPSACRVGSCGTCKARKTSGTVKHEHCPGLTEAEAGEGYVLTCSTTAEGVVVLEA